MIKIREINPFRAILKHVKDSNSYIILDVADVNAFLVALDNSKSN
jgi:uncharacterized protein (DUF1778 family)